MTWLLAIRGFLKAVPWQVWIGVGMAALLAVQTWRLSNAQEARDNALTALGGERVAHSVTIASLGALQADLEAMIEAGEVTAANLEKSVAEQKPVSDDLRAQADRVRVAVAEQCETPSEILNAGGL